MNPDDQLATEQLAASGAGATLAGAVAHQDRNRGAGLASTVLPPLCFGVLVIGLWYLISYVMLEPRRRFLLEPPHEVIKNGFMGEQFDDIMKALWSSTRVAAIGLVIAIILGLFLATVMSQAKIVERALFPYLVMLQAIPILAIVPLIAFWLGTGQKSRIIVCVIIALFPLIVNPLFGLQSAESGMHDLFTLHHASRITRLRKLMFPAAMPAIFTGLRISAGLSVIGAIVGDFFFGRGDVGIGQLLRKYANQLDGPELLTSVFVSCALGVAVFMLFGWLQNRVIGRWYVTGQSRD